MKEIVKVTVREGCKFTLPNKHVMVGGESIVRDDTKQWWDFKAMSAPKPLMDQLAARPSIFEVSYTETQLTLDLEVT